MRTLRVPFLVLAALALFTSAAADALVIVPFTNGKFEIGDDTWTIGEGAAVGDAEYSGDKEVILMGDATGPRFSGSIEAALAPATLPVTFAVESYSIEGVTLRLTLRDLRAPGAPAGGLEWSFPTLDAGRYYLDPADAAFPENAAWEGMTAEEREAELQTYLYAGLSFTALSVDPISWVDDFGVALGA